jgi:tetratricopeptide (TPR) repeat protein
MTASQRMPFSLVTALLWKATVAMSQTAPDFSERLDQLWDYNKPAESQQRFVAEKAKHPAGSREALETATQIARTQGLQRKFAEADATLDAVAPALDKVPARVRVRYSLERGRTRNSSGDKTVALSLFKEALAQSDGDKLPGAAFYRVDALHMLAIAAPPAQQLEWNRKALAAADASSDLRARGWMASLSNNIGWTYFDAGDAATALTYWKKALPLREAQGNPDNIRIAKWTIARGYRAIGKLDDAEKIQLALAGETEKAGEPDGYIYEELAEIAVARDDMAAAAPWAAKAYALLKGDDDLKANDAARLSRLEALGKDTSKTP